MTRCVVRRGRVAKSALRGCEHYSVLPFPRIPLHAPDDDPDGLSVAMNGKPVTKLVSSVPGKAALQWFYHCPTTVKSPRACVVYVVEDVIPLCAGFAEDPLNMQWLTIAMRRRRIGRKRVNLGRERGEMTLASEKIQPLNNQSGVRLLRWRVHAESVHGCPQVPAHQ